VAASGNLFLAELAWRHQENENEIELTKRNIRKKGKRAREAASEYLKVIAI